MDIQVLVGAAVLSCVLTGYHVHHDEHITTHDVSEMAQILSIKGRYIKPLRPRGYHEDATKAYHETTTT